MKLQVTLDVDVLNTENESEARECAFKLASSMNSVKPGRTPGGARATVTGIAVTVIDGEKATQVPNQKNETIEK